MSSTVPSVYTDPDVRNGAGPAKSLFLNASTPKPVPKPGEILVRVRAFGINRMDILQREGRYPVPAGASTILGVEFSGVVEALGDGQDHDSSGFAPGDEVFGLAYGGAYSEYIAAPTRTLLHKPPHLSWTSAAAVPEAWMTATQALFTVGRLDPADGKSVLLHAGGSGVAMAGVQLARAAGAARVYVTAGTDDKCAFATNVLHADAAFNYRTTPRWDLEIRRLEAARRKVGEDDPAAGVDLVVDFVGPDYLQRNIDVCARDGTIVLLSTLSGPKLSKGQELDMSGILRKRLRIEGSTLRSRDPEYQGRLRDRLQVYLADFESGKFQVVVDKIFPWDKVAEAHEYMETNKNTGKIVCTVP